jgi:hypothetical protein
MKATVLGQEEAIPWTNTDFVIAPMPCFFREETMGALVHMLGSRCPEGHRVFGKEGAAVAVWLSTEAVEQSFEHANTPWCPTCSMASVG